MPPTLNATILLLISPAILRVVIQETLEHEGYSVYPAGDLGTAVDKLKLSKPDLLIVSPYVEDMSGYDSAIFLRTKLPGLPVLMMGGIIADDRIQNRLVLKGFNFFPQPFTPADLLEKVKDALQKPR
jgi:two-component system, response regulator, stage 0 sporulation protein F